jgi:hypothetical protein
VSIRAAGNVSGIPTHNYRVSNAKTAGLWQWASNATHASSPGAGNGALAILLYSFLMRIGQKLISVLVCLWMGVFAFAQSDRGTITGTISDATGALIPGAKITLTNADTGTVGETVSTSTGNYTLPSLPAGTYTLKVEQAGFNIAQDTGIQVQVAVTTRLDVALQVGTATQSVDVSADASLLKTESAEQSTTITGDTINELPLNFSIGAGAVRNPLSFVQLTPGATISGWNTIKVNGNPTGTFRILFEGQESSSGLDARVSDEVQPSVEAIQEFTIQTSNFAAEFGQVAGGLFNFTSRSGTNQLHGSAYMYAFNEALNAGIPFTDNGNGEHIRPARKVYDGGFSVGGPVVLPKIYNGRNRTFFFWNYEKYQDRNRATFGVTTVPTDALRNGDFSSLLTGKTIGVDVAGRPILQNAIYDPLSQTTNAAGQLIRQVFPGNIIPASRIDPVAAKILATLPKPNFGGNLVNNYQPSSPFRKIQQIPSLKIDHNFTDRARISGYWSQEGTSKDVGQDGLPDPISIRRDLSIEGRNLRVNFDQTLTPSLLLHLGAGVQRYINPDTTPPNIANYDEAGILGIKGAPGTGFPRITGFGDNTYGGMALQVGPVNRGIYLQVKPTAVSQITWVRGNHTYKAGGEWKIDSFTNRSSIGLSPAFGFSSAQTAQALYGSTLQGGTTDGNGFASFLLGNFNSAAISNSSDPQYRKSSWGFFVQDTWKVTRKLTLDYGLRYDLQLPERELWNRTSGFSSSVVNPNANGLKGGIVYEGSGAGRCNCDLVPTYPYAIAPRLGAAYQLDQKTVIRAGWGLAYSTSNTFSYIGGGNSQGMGFNTINFTSPGNGVEAGKLANGLTWDPTVLFGASYNPGLLVTPGAAVQGAPAQIDPNGGRPPRVNQWNVSLQRQVLKDLVVEAAYVGNRGAWFQANNLVGYNTVDPATLQKLGLDITQPAVRTLLTSSIVSPVAVAAGFKKPYVNFPDSGTVIQSLRPFPQYGTINAMWAPLGKTWYDALQIKATKRYSHGLDATVSYAYSKNLTNFNANGNVYDRSSFKGLSAEDLPHVMTISLNYRLPAYGFVASNRMARLAFADWTLGGVLQYTSGQLLAAPTSNNSLGTYLPGQSSRQLRVSGQPLYLKDPNCGCIDPTVETILNPAAWVDQAPGVFGSAAAYYGDFRAQRRPSESLSIGKRFPIWKERMALSMRAEFFNAFNRLVSLPNPVTTNPATAPTRQNGVLTGGFGYEAFNQISSNNQNNVYPSPRTGQVVMRFEF